MSPNLPLKCIRTKKGIYTKSAHNTFVRKLFYLIQDNHNYILNVDHQKLPRTDRRLPLIWEQRYYDIAALDTTGDLFLIEIKRIPPSKFTFPPKYSKKI